MRPSKGVPEAESASWATDKLAEGPWRHAAAVLAVVSKCQLFPVSCAFACRTNTEICRVLTRDVPLRDKLQASEWIGTAMIARVERACPMA